MDRRPEGPEPAARALRARRPVRGRGRTGVRGRGAARAVRPPRVRGAAPAAGAGQPGGRGHRRRRRRAAIPAHLRSRLDAAAIFREILEHRWSLSEAAGGTSGCRRRELRRPGCRARRMAGNGADDADGDPVTAR
ncbi:DUF4032 domain-containing protein [Geodermatophilus obscurus]|uniref:DUF4032 domain-containing protein n=1 Tax=Geodermatophilus obscurus TaxID=1861 RepID=UPI0015881BC3